MRVPLARLSLTPLPLLAGLDRPVVISELAPGGRRGTRLHTATEAGTVQARTGRCAALPPCEASDAVHTPSVRVRAQPNPAAVAVVSELATAQLEAQRTCALALRDGLHAPALTEEELAATRLAILAH